MQFVMDSCGKSFSAHFRNSLSWHVYSSFWLHSILNQTIGRLQHHQLYDCHSCQMSHYSMSSQRRIHINVMSLHCMGNGGTTHYLLKGQWQTVYLWKSEKWKITFLSLNKAVLSNIYGTERKQGQRHACIDIVIGEGCHRIQVREDTKEKSGIVFGGSAYHWIAPRSFEKSNRLCFTLVCVWICVCMTAITHIHYQRTTIQEFHSNTTFPLFKKRKMDILSFIACRQGSNTEVLPMQMWGLCPMH